MADYPNLAAFRDEALATVEILQSLTAECRAMAAPWNSEGSGLSPVKIWQRAAAWIDGLQPLLDRLCRVVVRWEQSRERDGMIDRLCQVNAAHLKEITIADDTYSTSHEAAFAAAAVVEEMADRHFVSFDHGVPATDAAFLNAKRFAREVVGLKIPRLTAAIKIEHARTIEKPAIAAPSTPTRWTKALANAAVLNALKSYGKAVRVTVQMLVQATGAPEPTIKRTAAWSSYRRKWKQEHPPKKRAKSNDGEVLAQLIDEQGKDERSDRRQGRAAKVR